MKHIYVISAALVACVALTSCDKQAVAEKKSLSTDREKFSYAIGMEIGVSLQQIKDELDLAVLFQGISDTLNEKKLLLSDSAAMAAKDAVFKLLRDKQMTDQKQKGDENKKASVDFLEANKTREDVVTTASGLQYTVITEGKGPKPKETDMVKVHYAGTLLDGTEFDSSYKRGQPTEFPVNGVIKGWGEALQLMNVGSKYKLYIPPELAYGERGAGGQIPPNTTLVFEVELLDIVNK